MSRRSALTAVPALLVAALLGGCGGQDATPTPATTPSATSPATATAVPPASGSPTAGPGGTAVVARARGSLAVFGSPQDAAPTQTLPATTTFGTPRVLLVAEVGQGPSQGWLQVLLPVRPNGATGWVRADDVELRDVALEVRVDLAGRALTVLDAGQQVLSTKTAIGDHDHPTPTGRFYVVDKLRTPDAQGPYGPYALGLSAHSEVLTEFGGGDGQVGIHGTNVPSSIGRAASHGCLRVDNAIVEKLAHLLPLGTPVTIS
jgi:lipoprotein-anchoring transpeptidase ErfK/SrfK